MAYEFDLSQALKTSVDVFGPNSATTSMMKTVLSLPSGAKFCTLSVGGKSLHNLLTVRTIRLDGVCGGSVQFFRNFMHVTGGAVSTGTLQVDIVMPGVDAEPLACESVTKTNSNGAGIREIIKLGSPAYLATLKEITEASLVHFYIDPITTKDPPVNLYGAIQSHSTTLAPDIGQVVTLVISGILT